MGWYLGQRYGKIPVYGATVQAARPVEISVQFNQAPGAGPAVEIVHILGDQQEILEALVQLRYGVMSRIPGLPVIPSDNVGGCEKVNILSSINT